MRKVRAVQMTFRPTYFCAAAAAAVGDSPFGCDNIKW